jgi:hypothetical protein
MRIRFVPFVLLAVLLFSSSARAQGLPPPRVVPPPYRSLYTVLPPAGKPMPTLPLAASPYPVPGYQPSAYQVWQNYGWTYNGWIVPRIYQVNDGGFWLYNGAPFPYVYTMPGRHFSTIAPAAAPAP